MVRTKKKKTTKADNRGLGAEGGDHAALTCDLADQEQTQECATVMMQFAEWANCGSAESLDTLEVLKSQVPAGDSPGSNRIGFSQALAWKEEPEWQGELSEAEAETAIGSREPEGQVV